MNIELRQIPIKELVEDYVNDEDDGVVGYDGKLNIRPKYQREFVYKDKQRDEVINTVRKDFPLNVMYWVDNGNDTYEVLDGQQRTISICEYVDGTYSIDNEYFHTLQPDAQEQILDYKVMVYFCTGTDTEKLDWFKIINIAGEELTNQELRNAIYTGPWLTEAKRYFSKNGCAAYEIANKYLKGVSIRQEYLETVIKWISNNKIEKYMADSQFEKNCNELWLYFNNVITWVKTLFPNYRKEMKGIDWGLLYNKHNTDSFDARTLENTIVELMQDDDVTSKQGIYKFLITKNEKYLSLRVFDDKQKRAIYEKQKGICVKCEEHFQINEMEGDHIIAWSKGGKTTLDNCQMLCKGCNATKSNK